MVSYFPSSPGRKYILSFQETISFLTTAFQLGEEESILPSKGWESDSGTKNITPVSLTLLPTFISFSDRNTSYAIYTQQFFYSL